MTKTISFCVILLKFYFLNSVMRTVHTFSVPSAAHVIPIEDAPTLGVPGDWTHTNKYVVKAADGTEKVWTVRITEFKK